MRSMPMTAAEKRAAISDRVLRASLPRVLEQRLKDTLDGLVIQNGSVAWSDESLETLLRFFGHPYRTAWAFPIIKVGRRGNFLANWEDKLNNLDFVVEFFPADRTDWTLFNTTNGAIQKYGSELEGASIYYEPPFELNSEGAGSNTLPASDNELQIISTLRDEDPGGILQIRNGELDLAPSQVNFDYLDSRIDAAKTAINELVNACEEGNQPHAVLGEFAKQYRDALNSLHPSSSGISWYVKAQQIETYRANYVQASRTESDEYPPFDPRMSTIIDSLVLATGILARRFPEIAKSQDDFQKYSGREINTRREVRNLLSSALSAMAMSTTALLSPRAATVAREVAELDINNLDNDPATQRLIATKAGFLRNYLVTVAKASVVPLRNQLGHLIENIRTKGLYDLGKEMIKALVQQGLGSTIIFLGIIKPTLLSLSAMWPAMFQFIAPLLRLLGIG